MAQPELLSKDIVDLQDIEQVQMLQALQSDQGAYNSYKSEKVNRIIAETIDTKRASFIKASGDMARIIDMDHNSVAALNRTNDLANTQEQIITGQAEQLNLISDTTNMTRRQIEINNWYYENKRETLFVLQLILLVVLMLVIVLGVTSYGWLTEDASNYLLFFILMIGAGTWMYRWYYTTYIRDPKYWNQRRFQQDGKIPPSSGQICIGSNGEPQATIDDLTVTAPGTAPPGT